MSAFSFESWQAIGPHLDHALELGEEERRAWLSSLRRDNKTLADMVEELLDELRLAGQEGFLDAGPGELTGAPCPLAGKSVGAYTLRTLLGEGGMGEVWLAERSDGELQQLVAIKLLRAGRRRPGWRERFLRERQLLASLNHPAIVRAIDAGRTEDGRPYLVMEYVDGQTIDGYASSLAIRDRLQLFLRVCDGVSHAHRRLIVHRDLKPSNILVDATGQPKLLDFGIARLLDDTGNPTETIDRVLTPKYASPEQFSGAPQTTASDIYSLGAVLYQLLTGRAPRDIEPTMGRQTTGAAGPREIPAPSGVNRTVPRDLDYVIRKAMRDEPEERYRSIDSLAGDVRAVLEARPVEARAGDRWYHTRKFLRRHGAVAAAVVLIIASLSAGLYATNRERRIAERRFQQVRQLAERFIALDGEIRNLPGSTKARNQIVSESLAYLKGLGREAQGDSALAFEIGTAYWQIAGVQGVPMVANLGQYAQAEDSLRNADAFVQAVIAGNPRNRAAWLTSAQIHRDWMALVDYQNRRADTLAQAARAAAGLDAFLSLGTPTPDEVNAATLAYINISTAYTNSNRYDDAIRYCRSALRISQGVAAARMRRASAFGVLSISLLGTGDLDGALGAAHNSRVLLEQIATAGGPSERYNLVLALRREADVLGRTGGPSLGRSEEAAALLGRAVDMANQLAADDPDDSRSRIAMANASAELGDIMRSGDPAKALDTYDRALSRLREGNANGRSRRQQAELLLRSSYAARGLHRENDAKQRIDAGIVILRGLKEYPTDSIEPGSDAFLAMKAIADCQADTGNREQAIGTYEQLLDRLTAAHPNMASDLGDAAVMSDTWSAVSNLLRRAGRSAEAGRFDPLRVDLWTGWARRHPDNAFVHRQLEDARATPPQSPHRMSPSW